MNFHSIREKNSQRKKPPAVVPSLGLVMLSKASADKVSDTRGDAIKLKKPVTKKLLNLPSSSF